MEERSRFPEHQAFPRLFPESLAAEIPLLGRSLVLGFDILGMYIPLSFVLVRVSVCVIG
jgi:hypothetical protein